MIKKTKNSKRVSITKIIFFTMYEFTKIIVYTMCAFIVGIIGVSLPKTINFINGYGETAFYGYLASYSISAILFWIFTKDFKFLTQRESHFNQLKKIVKKLSESTRDKSDRRTTDRLGHGPGERKV